MATKIQNSHPITPTPKRKSSLMISDFKNIPEMQQLKLTQIKEEKSIAPKMVYDKSNKTWTLPSGEQGTKYEALSFKKRVNQWDNLHVAARKDWGMETIGERDRQVGWGVREKKLN